MSKFRTLVQTKRRIIQIFKSPVGIGVVTVGLFFWSPFIAILTWAVTGHLFWLYCVRDEIKICERDHRQTHFSGLVILAFLVPLIILGPFAWYIPKWVNRKELFEP